MIRDGILAKLCDGEDFFHPELLRLLSVLGETPRLHRKQWEYAMILRALEQLGMLNPDVDALGLACEIENLIYYITRHVRSVLATDLYAGDGIQGWAAGGITVDEVLARTPFPYPRERLSARSMDMRRIEAPDESFDVVWSSCALEHVDTVAQIEQTLREAARVLRPGGVHVLTTEWKLSGGFSYFPNCFVFDRKLLEDSLRSVPLEHIGPVDVRFSDHPLNTPFWPALDPVKPFVSHIVVFQRGVLHTSLSLALKKTDRAARPLDFLLPAPETEEWLTERFEVLKHALCSPRERAALSMGAKVDSAREAIRLAYRSWKERS